MRRAQLLLAILIFSSLLGHIRHFDLGPRGVHVWRQCNTLSVARNYAQEDMRILYPRVDHRKNTNGVTGMSFPLYEHLLAQTYRLFGEQHLNHRLLQWLITALGALGLYLLLMRIFSSEKAALVAVFAYLWSPEIYYHSINAIPDILAMSTVIWSTYFFLRFRKEAEVHQLLLCMLFLSIAGLVKLQFSLFGLWFLVDRVAHKRWDQAFILSILGLLAGGLISNWYIHSIWLRYENNLQDYGLFLNPADNWADGLRILQMNLLTDLPEQLIGYGMLPLVLIGLYFVMRKWHWRSYIGPLALVLSFSLFHIQELKQMEFHAYYMMPYVLFASLMVAFAVHRMNSRFLNYLIPVLIAGQLVHSLNKIQPRYSDEQSGLPAEFLDEASLTQLQEAVQASEASLVGPDPTGCVYFYYLNCKGWNAFSMDQIEEKDHIEAAFEKGLIQTMVIKDMDEARKMVYAEKYPYQREIGSFSLFSNASLQ